MVPKKSAAADGGPKWENSDSKSARTRARILDAAAHVLSIKGYSDTRLSDVADYAEVQAPAIYYYFASRDELIEEVMYAGIADMTQHLTQVLDALSPTTPPMERIMAAVEAHLRHELEIPNFATASIRNSGQVPPLLRARQLRESASYGRIWRRLIDDLAAAGQLRGDLDPRLSQLLIMGTLNWTAEWWDPSRGSLDRVVKNAQSIVRHGLISAGDTTDE